MRTMIGLAGALALAGCGSAAGLQPAPGEALPPAPRGALRQRTPAELLTPSTQARPQRSDELLTTSETRRSDAFSLPPAGTPASAVAPAPAPTLPAGNGADPVGNGF